MDDQELLDMLQKRFRDNMHRHAGIVWEDVKTRLEKHSDKLKSLFQMEVTGGEPDVIGIDQNTGAFLFCDCSKESPAGRRSLCYDEDALRSRKAHKPAGSALGMAQTIGIQVLDEDQYMFLQSLENFDMKSSSWLSAPESVRQAGGAIFGDHRFGRVFIYHNGAESYYGVRGFRGILRV